MARIFGVLIVGLLCAATAMAQPNCGTFNSSSPMAGTDLPYCQSRSLQCCTAEYLMRRRMEINDSIVDSLREELSNDENTIALMNLQETLERFVDFDFINAFIDDLPGLGRVPSNLPARGMFVNNFKMQLRRNFRINSTNQLNLTMYFGQLTMSLTSLLVQGINMQLPLNQTQRICVGVQIRNTINQTAIRQLINRIGQLRRISTSLYRILRWYRSTFLQRLANFRPLEQCVARFITLRCAACSQQNIPMVCRPRCGALVRGCLSPFNQGLRGQFNILWNVTRQIVFRGSRILEEIGSGERNFLNVDISDQATFLQFASTVAQRCGVTPSIGRRRRQANNQNMMFRPPNAVMGNASRLMGSFRFGNNGPRFCQNNPVTNCWNGMRTVDRDNIDFDNDNITDQANNPVEAFNVDDLIDQARALGTPVSDFFMSSEYEEIAPEDVTVPRGEAYTGGATLIKAAPILLLLLFAALVAIF